MTFRSFFTVCRQWLQQRSVTPRPPREWRFQAADGYAWLTCGEQCCWKIRLADVRAVAIITTDQGPWQDDLFWRFTVAERSVEVPASVTGYDMLPALLNEHFPDSDMSQLVVAMGSTENACFPLWAAD
ncbi:hypothetical protein [Bacterioplanoides pacificum]|uniref:Uncharacterized protein n=1 Tax=Bacterioplanoides pacificum TaxID=1171596 RepID=A0ABV7VUG1_9GAMM